MNNEPFDTAEDTVRVSSAQESQTNQSLNRIENLGEGSNENNDLCTQLEFGDVTRDLVSSSTPRPNKVAPSTKQEDESGKTTQKLPEGKQVPKAGALELNRLRSANALGIDEQAPLPYNRKPAPNLETATNVFTGLLQVAQNDLADFEDQKFGTELDDPSATTDLKSRVRDLGVSRHTLVKNFAILSEILTKQGIT